MDAEKKIKQLEGENRRLEGRIDRLVTALEEVSGFRGGFQRDPSSQRIRSALQAAKRKS
jgi:hypothetical protein